MKANISVGQSDESVEKKPCILVVDDDEDNLVLMAYITQSLNCKLIMAKEGNEAFSLAKESQPDLILVEMALEGISLIDRLQQDRLTRQIPIIAVTELAFGKQGERNIRPRGCELYIRKPYLLEELEMAFRQVLKSKLDANLKLH
jgi:CheY-like chemotaxis protein